MSKKHPTLAARTQTLPVRVDDKLTFSKLKQFVRSYEWKRNPTTKNLRRKRVYDHLEDLRILTDAENRIRAQRTQAPNIDAHGQYALFAQRYKPSKQLRADPVYQELAHNQQYGTLTRMADRKLSLEEYWDEYKHLELGPAPQKLLGITHANYTKQDLIGAEQ